MTFKQLLISSSISGFVVGVTLAILKNKREAEDKKQTEESMNFVRESFKNCFNPILNQTEAE